ncbi:ABC transporter ATP-binding protein [Sciscionella marina]|uniref:ABC transporter ATP-binding protein n=1 Tax=Sciscionella marina TaxID=508770 RepID=UPI000476AD02|nr:ABC transporter ATP-binding protein [Sciscionella marina]
MIRRLFQLWPQPRLLLRFALLEAVLAVLQGLLLGSLVPILGALLRAEPDFAAARPWLIGAAVGIVAHLALSVVATPAGFAASNELGIHLRRALMHHVTTLPLGWFDSQRRAEFVRAMSGAAGLATICVVVGGPVLNCVLVPTTIIGVTFAFDWRLALVLLAIAPVALVLLGLAKRTNMAVVDDMETATEDIVNRTIEFGQAQPVLRAAGEACTGTANMRHALLEHRRRYARGLNRLLVPDMSYTAAVVAGSAVVLVLGAWFSLSGKLEIAETIAVLVLAVRYLERLGALSGLVGGLGALDVAIGRIEDIMHQHPLPRSTEPVRSVAHSGIEFQDVHFAYSRTPVLSGVSFHCPQGSTTALVGPSGSGKTTITRLVARFFDVGSGQIRIGDIDIRDYDPSVLLEHIAIVFQDVYLFDTTIEENVRIAKPDATRPELEAAARAARLDEVIARQPNGWATEVGESGTQLSGGERQRVSIARAFLKQAQIVLIDEAASALDPENEKAISEAITGLAADPQRTVLVIAHAPATLAAADRVITLGHGTIQETGTPGELRHAGGAYAQIYDQYEHARRWRIAAP